MNEITLSTEKLNEMVAAVEKRAYQLSTPEGQSAAEDEMLKLFAQLTACGYRMDKDIDKRFMARTWAAQLQEHIATYGFKVLRQAVTQFINTDCREYKGFPTVSEITEVMKTLGVNPKAELAKKDLERRVKALEDEHRKEYDKVMTPEHMEYLEKRWGSKLKSLFESTEVDDK